MIRIPPARRSSPVTDRIDGSRNRWLGPGARPRKDGVAAAERARHRNRTPHRGPAYRRPHGRAGTESHGLRGRMSSPPVSRPDSAVLTLNRRRTFGLPATKQVVGPQGVTLDDAGMTLRTSAVEPQLQSRSGDATSSATNEGRASSSGCRSPGMATRSWWIDTSPRSNASALAVM